MNFGKKVAKLRKNKGMTQEQLAEHLNVTRQTISKWELGQSMPDLNCIKQISNFFDVTVDYLVKEEPIEGCTNVMDVDCKLRSNNRIESVEAKKGVSITSIAIAGSVLIIIGIAALIVGIVKTETIIWSISIVLIIMGLEMVLVKKHPMLVVLWTVWSICFVFLGIPLLVRILSHPIEYLIVSFSGKVLIVLVVALILLIITSVLIKKSDEKNNNS